MISKDVLLVEKANLLKEISELAALRQKAIESVNLAEVNTAYKSGAVQQIDRLIALCDAPPTS